jgi:iron complex transport system substrate-binding protein
LTVKDNLGRTVTIAARPERVVSLAPANTEILFAVAAGPQVVGLTKYCNYPPEASQGREIVGGFSAKSLSVEKIVALKPDVVFASDSAQQSVIEALEAARIPVVALNASGFEAVFANIQLAGRVTGHTTEAEKVVTGLKDRLAVAQKRVAAIPAGKRPKVFYEVWDEPLMTASNRSFIGQILVAAGAQNIFGDQTEQYPTISAETVIQSDPDVILGPDSHGDKLTAQMIGSRAGWQSLKAVTGKRVYTVNGDIISRPGPRVIDALEAVIDLLYGQAK